MERRTTPEVEVDVDAILNQLKQAKDKELHLRAEKERIRKTLESLRTGDLWSREAVTRQELEEIQARKKEVQKKESSEVEALNRLDRAVREKEVRIQKQQRPSLGLSVIKQAGASIVGPTSLVTDVSLQPLCAERARAQPTVEAAPSLPYKALTRETNARTHRRNSNQEADAMEKLALSINLDKQQQRIKRLEEQIEKSKTMRSTDQQWGLETTSVTAEKSGLKEARVAEELPSGYENSMQSHKKGTRDGDGRFQTTSVPPPVEKPVLQQRNTSSAASLGLAGPKVELLPLLSPFSTGSATDASGLPVGGSASQLHTYQSVLPGYSMAPPLLTQPYGGMTQYPHTLSMTPPMLPPITAAYPTVYPAVTPPMYPIWNYPAPSLGYSAVPSPFGYTPTATASQPWPWPSISTQATPVDTDVAFLRRQLESLQKNEQQGDEDKEFERVQTLLTNLQQQVSQLARTESSDSISSSSGAQLSCHQDATDSGLKAIKRHHLEALLKVRNERDLLEEQDKLEEVKERVEKRREERKRELHHEEWVTNQKRELMTLRLQRAITKADSKNRSDNGPVLLQADSDRSYDADVGVVLCWDFATGLPLSVETAQLAFAVYDGKIPRSTIKAIGSKYCESEGPSRRRAVFAAQRVVRPLPASDDLIVVIEISSVAQKNAADKPTIQRLGWIALELFHRSASTGTLQLASGFLKLALQTTPMPDPSLVFIRSMIADAPAVDGAECVLYCRLAHGDLEESLRGFAADPDTHCSLYGSPSTIRRNAQQNAKGTNPPPPTLLTTIPHKKDTPVESIAVPSSVPSESLPARRTTAASEDFLDVERLRLLSSSSTSARPVSGVARPQSTLLAAPKPRVGLGLGLGGGLQAVREDVAFDDQSPSSPWIRVDKSLNRQRRLARSFFQLGDAFNVLIDGARYLPDNVTITKVTVAALNADRTKVSPQTVEQSSQTAVVGSDANSPVYNLYAEYREKSFNPTLTLIARVDTLDLQTKQSVIVGYASFPVFFDPDTHQQPTRPSATQFTLNEGAFQLPLYANASLNDATKELTAATALAGFSTIPIATILIRVKQAVMSEDGLSILSRRDFPPEEWSERGLDEPAPPYYAAEYDSSWCQPTALEFKMYQQRDEKKKRPTTVNQMLKQIGLGEAAAVELLQSKPTSFINLRTAFRYQPAIGFRVSIDGLHNLKVKAGSFCKVLFSVSPPATFYQSIRLTSDLHLTTTTDWTSVPSSPEFKDGFVAIRDSPVHRALIVVIDVRVVTKTLKTGPYSSVPFAWTFLPVLNDKTGSVAVGNYQLPLFTGEVKLATIESSLGLGAVMEEISMEKKKATLPFVDGASVFVRLEDPQVSAMSVTQPITDAVMSTMVPTKAIARYQYDSAKMVLLKKKSPLSKQIPQGMTEKQLEKEINESVATQLGIHHYSF